MSYRVRLFARIGRYSAVEDFYIRNWLRAISILISTSSNKCLESLRSVTSDRVPIDTVLVRIESLPERHTIVLTTTRGCVVHWTGASTCPPYGWHKAHTGYMEDVYGAGLSCRGRQRQASASNCGVNHEQVSCVLR